MSPFPSISIVTPSYNQQDFLEATIKSVVDQGYPNLEYIVIDGGSADESASIIRSYSDRISYWRSEPDGGHGDALSIGFSHSSGEIMGWINSDDMLTPWSLNTVADIFTQFPHINWIHGTNSWWNVNGQMINTLRVYKNIYDYLLGDFEWIQQESVFWRRSLWEEAGGHITKSYKFMVDGELWSRFFLIDKLYTVDCVLSGYRVHGSNRARHNLAACLSEMHQIIADLELKCCSDVTHNLYKLRSALRFARFPLFRKTIGLTSALKLYDKLNTNKLLMDTGYDKLTWDLQAGSWIEKRIPFR